MGLYSTICEEQVKCFFAPCLTLSDEKDTKLSFYSSGGRLKYYTKGNEVPYDSNVYNYGKDFVIFDYRKYLGLEREPIGIFIKDGKVFDLIQYDKITDKDFEGYDLVIDNYGEPLKITSAKDFINIVDDYIQGYKRYEEVALQYRKENECEQYAINVFKIPRGPIPSDVMEKIKLAGKLGEKAFVDTVVPLNEKWKYSENTEVYTNIHFGYECGYIFENLTDDILNEETKFKVVELFSEYCLENKKHTLEQEIKEYIDWLKRTNSRVSEKEVITTFKKYDKRES